MVSPKTGPLRLSIRWSTSKFKQVIKLRHSGVFAQNEVTVTSLVRCLIPTKTNPWIILICPDQAPEHFLPYVLTTAHHTTIEQ